MPTASQKYSLLYWKTTTERLAPKTYCEHKSVKKCITQIDQPELLHFRKKHSCDTILSLSRALCGRMISPPWLKTLLTAALEAGTLKALIAGNRVCRVMFDSCAGMPSKNVKFKPCAMQDSCYKIFMLGICTHVNKYLDLKYNTSTQASSKSTSIQASRLEYKYMYFNFCTRVRTNSSTSTKYTSLLTTITFQKISKINAPNSPTKGG